MSPEYSALIALRRPTNHAAGDMWICRRLGWVRVMNGHKKGQAKRRRGLMSFSLYHWTKPELIARPCDWRDDDMNATTFDPDKFVGEKWEYLGNIFHMLPYAALAGSRTG